MKTKTKSQIRAFPSESEQNIKMCLAFTNISQNNLSKLNPHYSTVLKPSFILEKSMWKEYETFSIPKIIHSTQKIELELVF